MKSQSQTALVACSLAALAACSADGAKQPNAQVTIKSAALDTNVEGSTFDPILDVCYGITVFNGIPNTGDTQIVWSNDQICSSSYGNAGGGDITYVGPCDASVTRDNYIVLTIGTVSTFAGALLDQDTAGDADSEFQNPCTALHPCIQHFECKENQDVFVSFDLTIMRDADQGFFDIVVNFEDVFCSAKVDTCYAPDKPIELLFGDDVSDGLGRDHTAVAAVACTAGPDTATSSLTTELLFTSRTVTCDDDVVFHLDPPGPYPDGRVVVTLPGPILSRSAEGGGKTATYEEYFGNEQLNCDGHSCNKAYFNTAIDIENLAGQHLTNCKLSFYATAHAVGGDDGFVPATGKFSRPGGMYAAIQALDVPLTNSAGDTICNAHPLDGKDFARNNSLVSSQYIGTLAATNPAFCYASTDGAAMTARACATTVDPIDCPDGESLNPDTGLCTPCHIGCAICQPPPGIPLLCESAGEGMVQCTLLTTDYDRPFDFHMNTTLMDTTVTLMPNGNHIFGPFAGTLDSFYTVSSGGLQSTPFAWWQIQCTSCESGYSYALDGICTETVLPICDAGTILEGDTCNPCQPGCADCAFYAGNVNVGCVADGENVVCTLYRGAAGTTYTLYDAYGTVLDRVDGSADEELPFQPFIGSPFATYVVGSGVGGEEIIVANTEVYQCTTCDNGSTMSSVGTCVLPLP